MLNMTVHLLTHSVTQRMLNMIWVTAILLASFLASASSQFDCPLVDSFCDPEDAQYDLGELTGNNLLPTATAADAAEECYTLCNAQSDQASDPKCEDFTVLKI